MPRTATKSKLIFLSVKVNLLMSMALGHCLSVSFERVSLLEYMYACFLIVLPDKTQKTRSDMICPEQDILIYNTTI